MIDAKIGGDKNWPHAGVLFIPGNPSLRTYSPEQGSEIIRGWPVAVLRAIPGNVPFTLLFINDDNAQYLRPQWDPALPPWQRRGIRTTNGLFGVRIGDDDTTYVAMALDRKRSVTLEYVETVTFGDLKYPDLYVN